MKPASKKTGDEQVGLRIAARRKALEMSREELASQIGASYALVAQIETGWRMPSYEKQLLIAKSLGVGLDEVFGQAADFLAPPEDTTATSIPDAASAAPVARFAAAAAAAFPLGSIPVAPAAQSAPARPSAPLPPPKPTFDQVVERAAEGLRDLPASRRLDALSRLQLIVMREVADEERRRVGSDQHPSGWITDLAPDEVFVFGSNAEGRHAGGASRTAYERFGAEWGQGRGHHGQSYAIVTTSGLSVLHDEVARFLVYARRHPELRFLLTPIGTGTAGYRTDEVAPLFAGAPHNVVLPGEFEGA
ncbi:helix-turn-helix domain-containing protein [Microbacterium sp. BWT-B31]|uniref:A1S_2505 family phage non-structural protein n=1 Tax=Microbacterium sp. BWT-B31 TaxID=3232072 RepID=UPI0035271ABD